MTSKTDKRGTDTRRRTAPSSRYPRARKRFGQHFLEAAWVRRLIDVVAPDPDDVFVEIGPGRGALTRQLAPRVAKLIGIEIDRDLAAALAEEAPPHVTVVQGDVLDVDLEQWLAAEARPVRVIGNLPYNVATPILFQLLGAAAGGRRIQDATLMVQKEVADRLTASIGGADYGTLAIQVSLVADVDRLLTLPPGAFRPPPKVTSAVVRLRFRSPAFDVGDSQRFSRLVRGLFLHRRKTLANALVPVAESLGQTAAQMIVRAGVDPRKRPQELSLDELARLSRAVL